MNKNIMVIGAVVVVVLVGGIMLFSNQGGAPNQPAAGTEDQENVPVVNEPAQNETTPPPAESAVKEFRVVGSPFKFSPNEIKVKQGDTVRIVFVNESGNHDWRIDEFNAATKVIKGGETDTVQFVVDKKGTFEFYCSVGTHRQMGMKGNLIVE